MKCSAVPKAVVIGLMGLAAPWPLLATGRAADAQATPTAAPAGRIAIADVALRPGGVLNGQVVDASGRPRAGAPVWLVQADRPVATALTDANGYFAFQNLPGGAYVLVAGQNQVVCRLWSPGTAPPSAQSATLIVCGEAPVRGQQGPLGCWMTNPWVLGGIAATAITVPIVLFNQHKHHVASP